LPLRWRELVLVLPPRGRFCAHRLAAWGLPELVPVLLGFGRFCAGWLAGAPCEACGLRLRGAAAGAGCWALYSSSRGSLALPGLGAMRLRGEFCSLWSGAGADFALWLSALSWSKRSEGIMGLPGRVQTGGMLRNTGTGTSAAREPRRELEAPLPVDAWRDAAAPLPVDAWRGAAALLAADTWRELEAPLPVDAWRDAGALLPVDAWRDGATVLAVDAWRDAATVLTADASRNLGTLASLSRLLRKVARAFRASAAWRARS